jgi:D-alanyl-D-alanine carboxypeptidase (penicillin-binding protein 5/6)
MTSWKKLFAGLLLFFLFPPSAAWSSVDIDAAAGILINARTGEILWEKESHASMHPASTTKILTAILLLENTSADEVALTSRQAAGTPGSSLYLSENQQVAVSDLLYAMMLHSANDAAVVAAEHVAGSVEVFAAMMNRKAQQVGALNSHFANPHGLTEKEHRSTAYDLAMIASYAMKEPRFREICVTRHHVMPWPDGERSVQNKNPLLHRYQGMIGIKAGYTVDARRTFVGAAERDGLELIVVILNAGVQGIWEDAQSLLDYGFTHFVTVKVEKGNVVGALPIRHGDPVVLQTAEDYEVTVPAGPLEVTLAVEDCVDRLVAPVMQGEEVGVAVVVVNGNPVGNVKLVAAESVSRAPVTTGRFWVLSGMFGLSGLRIRKLIRKRRRKKRLYKKSYRSLKRKF